MLRWVEWWTAWVDSDSEVRASSAESLVRDGHSLSVSLRCWQGLSGAASERAFGGGVAGRRRQVVRSRKRTSKRKKSCAVEVIVRRVSVPDDTVLDGTLGFSQAARQRR